MFGVVFPGGLRGKNGFSWVDTLSSATALAPNSTTVIEISPFRLARLLALPFATALFSLANAQVSTSCPTRANVIMNPSSAALRAGQSQPLALMIGGAPATNVKWTLDPQVGVVSSVGVYTAPAAINGQQTVVVTGRTGNTTCSTAKISLVAAAVAVTVSPTAVTLAQSGSQQLIASVAGSTNQSVKWTMSPNVGSLSTNGTTAVYTAPNDFEQQQTVDVVARSMADSTKLAQVIISLLPAISVSINPVAAETPQGSTQQFTATVKGSPSKEVMWTLNPQLGTVSPSGLYSAPANAAAGSVINVIAQAKTDPAKKAVARVQIAPSNNLTMTVGPNGLETLAFRGVDFNYRYGETMLAWVGYTKPDGTTYAPPPVCNRSVVGNQVTQECNIGGHPATATAVFSSCGAVSVCADVQVTNNDKVETIAKAMMAVIGIQTKQFDSDRSNSRLVDFGNPVGIMNYVEGQWMFWIQDPEADKNLYTSCGFTYICKHQPQFLNILPGQTRKMRVVARVTADAAISPVSLAPEAYQAFRDARPSVIAWPDRRPIMSWFIGEVTKRSPLNPRGYLQDATLDVSDLSAFRTRVLAAANKTREMMDARPVRPQGLIIWDLEGQEFVHATTYVGDPTVFGQGYAPEMNAVADDLFKVFRGAGYRVGVTLRPQYLAWGTQLPATCNFNQNHDYMDYFIKVNAPFKEKFYACYDPLGKTYALIPDGNGGQTVYPTGENARVLALLKRKVQYAKDRWGASIFYVDSAVWSGGAAIDGQIFRDLQQTFPDVLFIPEQEYLLTLSAAIPFSDPRIGTDPRFTNTSWRWVYPNAAIAIRLPDCQGDCWTANYEAFKVGQKTGDIALYDQPGQMFSKQLTAIEAMIQDARKENSTITVMRTERSTTLTFAGTPNSVAEYPVKMRVYFAKTASALGTSEIFCETSQWSGESSCNLDLTGVQNAQIRYYDFAGGFVTAGPILAVN